MANYNLYFNLPSQGMPFKKIVSINVSDFMSIYGILDIANLHLSNVGIMAGIQGPNSDGEMETRTIPMKLGKVEMWQYFEKYNGFIGIADVENNPLPIELKAVAFLQEVESQK